MAVLPARTVYGASPGPVMQLMGWDAVLYASMPAIVLAMAAILWARPDREGAVAG